MRAKTPDVQTATKTKTGDLLKTELRPLTRCQANGDLLTRLPETEKAIREILELDWGALIERLKITDKENPLFIIEEVLVFLLRAALAAGKIVESEQISEILFKRVEKRIKSYARKFVPKAYVEEAVGDMLGDLFMKICNIESDKCDFAQIRFWLFFKRLCGESWGKYQAQGKLDDWSLFLDKPDPRTEKPGELEAEEKNYSATDWQDIRKGLNVLPEPIRTAFILRYGEGWQVESKDPAEVTISRHFAKTERTIRNWLTRAEELLTDWRAE